MIFLSIPKTQVNTFHMCNRCLNVYGSMAFTLKHLNVLLARKKLIFLYLLSTQKERLWNPAVLKQSETGLIQNHIGMFKYFWDLQTFTADLSKIIRRLPDHLLAYLKAARKARRKEHLFGKNL